MASLLWLHLFFLYVFIAEFVRFCTVTLHDVAIALFAFSCCWWHVVAESVCWVWWCWPVLIFRPWSPITSGPGEMKSKTVLLDFCKKEPWNSFFKSTQSLSYITFEWGWLKAFIVILLPSYSLLMANLKISRFFYVRILWKGGFSCFFF